MAPAKHCLHFIFNYIDFLIFTTSQLRKKLFVQLLQVVLGDLVSGPADDETFLIGCGWLRDDMEVNVVDFLVGDLAVVLQRTRSWRASNRQI